MGELKGSKYYDERFGEKRYNVPAEDTVYYPLWQAVLWHLDEKRPIWEYGCGTGQFADLALRNGYNYECGTDFSKIAIDRARERTKLPSKFEQADAFSWAVPDKTTQIVLLEVLEHIKDDLALLKRFPYHDIVFTVPNFDSASHVRHFRSKESVEDHYKPLLGDISVIPFNVKNHLIFLVSRKKVKG